MRFLHTFVNILRGVHFFLYVQFNERKSEMSRIKYNVYYDGSLIDVRGTYGSALRFARQLNDLCGARFHVRVRRTGDGLIMYENM